MWMLNFLLYKKPHDKRRMGNIAIHSFFEKLFQPHVCDDYWKLDWAMVVGAICQFMHRLGMDH